VVVSMKGMSSSATVRKKPMTTSSLNATSLRQFGIN
jgi:hypothetical protein